MLCASNLRIETDGSGLTAVFDLSDDENPGYGAPNQRFPIPDPAMSIDDIWTLIGSSVFAMQQAIWDAADLNSQVDREAKYGYSPIAQKMTDFETAKTDLATAISTGVLKNPGNSTGGGIKVP